MTKNKSFKSFEEIALYYDIVIMKGSKIYIHNLDSERVNVFSAPMRVTGYLSARK